MHSKLNINLSKRLKNMVQTEWSDRKALPPELHQDWQYRQDLLVADGLLMKCKRLVIPVTMQEEMLNKIHEGHQGPVFQGYPVGFRIGSNLGNGFFKAIEGF